MNTKSKLITGVAIAAGVGALALGGVSVANAAPGTATSSQPTTASAPAAPPAATTPTAVPAMPPAAAPSPTSDDAPLIYTALTRAEVTKLGNADMAEAAALSPEQRAVKFKSLLAQSKALPAHDPTNVDAEKVSIAVKSYAETN